jgi:hypothetical protein
MAKRQRRRRQVRRREHAKLAGWKTRHSVITGAGIAAGAVLGVSSPAVAQTTFEVNAANDLGDGTCEVTTNECTLRDAIDDANATAGYDYVTFQSGITGTINLTAGEIPITDSVFIFGPGANVLTVDAAPNSRIFSINPATTGHEVGIYDLTLTGGDVAGAGGAIYNSDAELSVVDSVLTGNSASAGGAIFEAGGSNYGRNLVVAYSTLDHNSSAYGGAIAGEYSAGIVGGSTIASNTASVVGGGVFNYSGGYGLTLFDSTISGNSSAEAGGGITTYYAYSYNTIAANNAGSNSTDTFDVYLYAVGSLIESPGSTVYGATNIAGVDPQLGGLGDNGGITPTLKPAASSPVVDKGFSYAYYDQRGNPFARIVDNPNVSNAFGPPYGAADIGSVELTLAEGPQGAAPPATPAPVRKKKKKCKKKKGKKSAEAAKKKKCKKKKRSAHPAAPAIRAWRAQAAAHQFERHWGDRAWKFDR